MLHSRSRHWSLWINVNFVWELQYRITIYRVTWNKITNLIGSKKLWCGISSRTSQNQQGTHIQQHTIFQFKFTANVSGPTSCGKTFFVKLLLETCLSKISTPLKQIIWLYKRWQPLYDVIKDTVSPSVEFIKGIPMDSKEDSLVNPQTRNCSIRNHQIRSHVSFSHNNT